MCYTELLQTAALWKCGRRVESSPAGAREKFVVVGTSSFVPVHRKRRANRQNADELSWNSTTPTATPTRTSSRGSSPTRPTRAISLSYSFGKLNDTPTFSRRSSRGCRRRGMPALLIELCDGVYSIYCPVAYLYWRSAADDYIDTGASGVDRADGHWDETAALRNVIQEFRDFLGGIAGHCT